MMDDWIKDYMEICYLLLLAIIFSSSYGMNKYLQFVISLYDLYMTLYMTYALCMDYIMHGPSSTWVLGLGPF